MNACTFWPCSFWGCIISNKTHTETQTNGVCGALAGRGARKLACFVFTAGSSVVRIRSAPTEALPYLSSPSSDGPKRDEEVPQETASRATFALKAASCPLRILCIVPYLLLGYGRLTCTLYPCQVLRSIIDDELVKSHIPYVVHASTMPVLSEPFVPSRASLREPQGER